MSITFVYPPTLDWSILFQRPQQLARALAHRGHTFYFSMKTQTPGRAPEPLESDPGVVLVHDWPAFHATLHTFDHVLLLSWSEHRSHLHECAHDLSIFDALDAFPEWATGDAEAMKVADLVLCTSGVLLAQAKALRGDSAPTVVVRNACDPAHWLSPGPAPAWLEAIPSPRVLFCGYPGSWVDLLLIRQLAVLCPTYSFVFVGPKPNDDPFPANVFLAGEQTYDDLPAIFGACQAGIVPFKRDDPIAIAADPIKQYEYLAAGLPVVSTDIPEALPVFVQTASSPNRFAHLLVLDIEADNDGRREARQQIAATLSWANAALSIETEVLGILDAPALEIAS